MKIAPRGDDMLINKSKTCSNHCTTDTSAHHTDIGCRKKNENVQNFSVGH